MESVGPKDGSQESGNNNPGTSDQMKKSEPADSKSQALSAARERRERRERVEREEREMRRRRRLSRDEKDLPPRRRRRPLTPPPPFGGPPPDQNPGTWVTYEPPKGSHHAPPMMSPPHGPAPRGPAPESTRRIPHRLQPQIITGPLPQKKYFYLCLSFARVG